LPTATAAARKTEPAATRRGPPGRWFGGYAGGPLTPPSNFAIFGLAPSYEVDGAALKAKWLDLQRETHPDLVAARPGGGGADELEAARARSSLVNEAYAVLKDDLRRAEHLLRLASGEGGQHVPEEDARVEDMGLLMEVMEAREEIEEALLMADGDEAKKSAAVGELEGRLRKRRAEAVGQLQSSFVAGLVEGGDEGALAEAREGTMRLKYVVRAIEELTGVLADVD